MLKFRRLQKERFADQGKKRKNKLHKNRSRKNKFHIKFRKIFFLQNFLPAKFSSRKDFFPQRFLPSKISSLKDFFPQRFLPSKISSLINATRVQWRKEGWTERGSCPCAPHLVGVKIVHRLVHSVSKFSLIYIFFELKYGLYMQMLLFLCLFFLQNVTVNNIPSKPLMFGT